MRVLFVHRWGVTMAGGEVWIRNLAGALQTQGVQVVAALHTDGPLVPALRELHIPVHLARLDYLRGSPRSALLPSAGGLVASALRLRTLIRDSGSSVIHAFSPESAEPALLAARLAGVPLVVTVMNCGPFPQFDRVVLRRADRIIAISEAVAGSLADDGVPTGRIRRVPLGISTRHSAAGTRGRLRSLVGVPEGTPIVGMVANLEPKKAQDVLIRATPAILRYVPNAEVVLIGRDKSGTDHVPGAYESQLRQLAGALGIADRVHFLGFVPEAASLMADLDVGVLCSRHEAQGLAAVESLVAGVPFVATAVEGLKEVIRDGVTGLLVPPDDHAALAAAVVALLTDRSRATALAAAGRRDVLRRYDAQSLAAGNLAVYRELLAPRAAWGAA